MAAKAGRYFREKLEDAGVPFDGAAVTSVNGEDGDVVLTASDVGALADNTTAIANANIAAGAAIALSKLANVAAGTDGLSAGTLQATLQALATRIQALEDA